MLIYPRPSEFCDYCNVENPCTCQCHEKDLINSKHYHVHIEEFAGQVNATVNLEHFRN